MSSENRSQQMEFIVSKLNDSLSLSESLVSFDEKSPVELLQLLSDVFSLLSPVHKRDVRDETPEQTVFRLMDFLLRILYFKVTIDITEFRNGLASGDRTIVHPILFWVLQRLPDLKKRVYLSRFLVPVDMPEDFLADDMLRELLQQFKQMQDEFVHVHRSVDKMREAVSSPQLLKTQLAQLEEEKEKLNTKIASTRRKIENQPNSTDLVTLAAACRKETEEAARLVEKTKEQEQFLITSERRLQESMIRLRDTKKEIGDISVDSLVDRVRAEAEKNRVLAQDQLPRQLRDSKERMESLNRIAYEPVDADELSADIRRLQLEVGALQEKANASSSFSFNNSGASSSMSSSPQPLNGQPPRDEKLSLFRQQATLVARKREEALQRLQDARSEIDRLQAEKNAKEREAEGFKDSKILKGEEFKKYANSLRGKSTQYKRLRSELAEVRSDLGVLIRTEEILKSRDANLQDFLDQQARKRSVVGFRETQDNLEKISAAKSEVDEEKGRTLEEVSKLVAEISNAIKDRKNKLAPQIVELRTVRQQVQEQEQEYLEKKAIYDNTAVGLESERLRLEQEVSQFADECQQAESMYHLLNGQLSSSQLSSKRCDDEVDFRLGRRRFSDQHKTYQEVLLARTQQLEAQSKDLREKQRYIKENHEPNLRQMAYFSNVRRLLECKLSLYRSQTRAQQSSEPMDYADGGMVDRLVL